MNCRGPLFAAIWFVASDFLSWNYDFASRYYSLDPDNHSHIVGLEEKNTMFIFDHFHGDVFSNAKVLIALQHSILHLFALADLAI